METQKTITLSRDDFKEPTAEVNYFNDYLLTVLGIDSKIIPHIAEVELDIRGYDFIVQ